MIRKTITRKGKSHCVTAQTTDINATKSIDTDCFNIYKVCSMYSQREKYVAFLKKKLGYYAQSNAHRRYDLFVFTVKSIEYRNFPPELVMVSKIVQRHTLVPNVLPIVFDTSGDSCIIGYSSFTARNIPV